MKQQHSDKATPSGPSSSTHERTMSSGEQYMGAEGDAETYYYFQQVPPSAQQQFTQLAYSSDRPYLQQPQAKPHSSMHNRGVQHPTLAPQHLQSATGTLPGTQQLQPQKRKEIYRYVAPFDLYAMGWSCRQEPEFKFRLAVGSFIEEYNNKISIVQLNEEQGEFTHLATFDHPYPATKCMWMPDAKSAYPDLLATTGDYLRLWRVGGNHGATLEILLNNNRSSEYCAPLTSADWNELDPSLLGTSSIDTTCTIWQIETGQALATTDRSLEGTVKTQLIAHDKEVYDIAFSKLSSGREIFASAGADGSIRMFDLRHMDYSTILFEEPNRLALPRLAWNKQDPNYLATFAQNSNEVFILDIRMPSVPVATLKNHSGPVNGIAWAPHSTCHIVTAAEDCQALIWDVHSIPRPVDDPILAYSAAAEINQVYWSSTLTDWISICYNNHLELLRV